MCNGDGDNDQFVCGDIFVETNSLRLSSSEAEQPPPPFLIKERLDLISPSATHCFFSFIFAQKGLCTLSAPTTGWLTLLFRRSGLKLCIGVLQRWSLILFWNFVKKSANIEIRWSEILSKLQTEALEKSSRLYMRIKVRGEVICIFVTWKKEKLHIL